MKTTHNAQLGLLSDPAPFADYLTLVLHDDITDDGIADALAALDGVHKSIRQKAPESGLSTLIGFSARAWPRLFAEHGVPQGLNAFKPMQDGPRIFPATPGDIFIMIKSTRMDLNFQAAKYCRDAFADIATLTEDVQGYVYLDNRDMIDFVDGTENPIDEERASAVLADDIQPEYCGGSFLTVQQYIHKSHDWESQKIEYQEEVVGRTKLDNIELDDDTKPAWAHNNKSKVEVDGEEIKMFRQNRPFGNALEHGTMLIGFAKDPSVIDTSLTQMITADENGDYDRLLDFVDARTGACYFVPPQSFIDAFCDD